MRICLFTSTALPRVGGQEWVVDQLARQFQALGHDACVLAPHPQPPLKSSDHALPYRVFRTWRWRARGVFLSLYARSITQLYRRWKFDILHCHNLYPPAYLASLVRRQVPVPVVVTSHGGDVYDRGTLMNKPHLALPVRQAVSSADALISISKFTTEGLMRICPKPRRLALIPNGINMTDYAGAAPRPAGLDAGIVPGRYAVFLGRFSQRKGVDVLLRAWKQSALEGEASLVVVGDGEEMPRYRALARELDITRSVHFTGARSGMEKVYLLQNARLGVIPSRDWEAFPLVVLEMQAAGLPIVATDIPGLRDLIDPGVTGTIVPSEDAAALGRALAELWRSEDKVRAMGQAAAALAPSFAWPVIAQKHLDLFDSLLKERAQQ